MTEWQKKITQQEKRDFKLDRWHERLLRAQAYRISCGWEENAEEAISIRKNDINVDLKQMPNYKGELYVDNWLWKNIKWLIAMQMGASLQVDIKSYLENTSRANELLEMEVNWAIDQFKLQDAVEDSQQDRYYPGYGVVRGVWNSRRVTPNYPTGTPQYIPINAMNVWWDEASKLRDKSDIRWLFHQEYVDVAELKRRYPKWADKIPEQSEWIRGANTESTPIVTMQYRRVVTKQIVIIEDQDAGQKKEFLLEEWEEFIDQARQLPETTQQWQQEMMDLREQGKDVIDFEDWLVQGAFLPEKVVMLGPLDVEEDAIFQAIYLHDADILLEPPQYVGKSFTYFILPGYHEPDCAYPTGLATFMKGSLKQSIILMTALTIQAARIYKNEKLIHENSLVNQSEYEQHGYELGVNPIVRSEWSLERPGEDAVKHMQLPSWPQGLMLLNEHLINQQKTMSGATDAIRGEQTSSGQSGIQVAQLQTAARTYQREDIEIYRRFLEQIISWTMDETIRHRNYPHQTPGLVDDKTPGLVDVATSLANRLDVDDYHVEVTIQENEEVVKQTEREFYRYLVERGYITPLSFMQKTDVPNPEKENQEAEAYKGELQMLEILRSVPGAAEMLQQFAANQQQQGSPGGSPVQSQ